MPLVSLPVHPSRAVDKVLAIGPHAEEGERGEVLRTCWRGFRRLHRLDSHNHFGAVRQVQGFREHNLPPFDPSVFNDLRGKNSCAAHHDYTRAQHGAHRAHGQ
jgi:hypothetical protein